ncbi:MAG: cytochrome c biogenesis protein CcsA [Desulfovibrionales bacterium]
MTYLTLLELGIVLLYLLGVILLLAGMLGQNRTLEKFSLAITVLGFVLQSADIGIQALGFGELALLQQRFYFNLLAWTLMLIYLVLWWKMKLQLLALIAAPLALIFYASSIALNTQQISVPEQLSGLWFSLHIGTLFLSFSLMAMAFGAGAAYLYIERKIKTKTRLEGFQRDLPSLTTFDRVNHWAVSIGFPLFTLGLLAGFLWARFTWGHLFSWDPKEVATLFIWVLYGFLFHQRMALGWKGRKPARLAIWVFTLTVISLVGVNFLLPSHHSFQ